MSIGQFAYANHGNRFLGVTELGAQAFAIAGVPFDGAVTNRPGARFGPQEIRRASLTERFVEIGQHPLVAMAETCGFMAGLVLVKNKQPLERFAQNLAVGMICRSHCFKNGLIMRAVGDRMIIAPPLTMTHTQIDEMMALILRCLDLTYQEVKKNGWLA